MLWDQSIEWDFPYLLDDLDSDGKEEAIIVNYPAIYCLGWPNPTITVDEPAVNITPGGTCSVHLNLTDGRQYLAGATLELSDGEMSGDFSQVSEGFDGSYSFIYTARTTLNPGSVITLKINYAAANGESTSANITLRVIGPMEKTEALISYVKEMGLHRAAEKNICTRLDKVLEHMQWDEWKKASSKLQSLARSMQNGRGQVLSDGNAEMLTTKVLKIVGLIEIVCPWTVPNHD